MPYLTVKEAVALWGKHPDTIYRWIEEGRLKAKRDPGGYGWWVEVPEKYREGCLDTDLRDRVK